jgi:hypothetical protein
MAESEAEAAQMMGFHVMNEEAVEADEEGLILATKSPMRRWRLRRGTRRCPQ